MQEKDLETWLEVGAWTWNWMEPPLGTITFVLLCMQLSRSHMQVNLESPCMSNPIDAHGISSVLAHPSLKWLLMTHSHNVGAAFSQALFGNDGWWAVRQRRRRAKALLEAYPQYNQLILLHWSHTLYTQVTVEHVWEPLHVSRF